MAPSSPEEGSGKPETQDSLSASFSPGDRRGGEGEDLQTVLSLEAEAI
jgi:hypothetical protein